MEIAEKIKETIDSGKFGCGIFIDLKKAFDTVNHKILLSKLEHYGVRELEACLWIGSNHISLIVIPNVSEKLNFFLFSDMTLISTMNLVIYKN